MPNGGSDCCGACWFNRSNGGQLGSVNFKPDIPSFCEIRDLPIPNPFYTYCANHPYHRPNRDPIPIGPVYVHGDNDVREFWQPSPDSEEIRQHLLEIVRAPEEHTDGYPFFSAPPHARAIEQLLGLRRPAGGRGVEGPRAAGRSEGSSSRHPRADQDRASKTGPVTEVRWHSLGTGWA